MVLKTVVWNLLYAAQPYQRRVVKRRIESHYKRMGLERRGVEVASTRPTGWHGESRAATSGGHVTVDFSTGEGTHIVTHHIYRKDEAYKGRDRAYKGRDGAHKGRDA